MQEFTLKHMTATLDTPMFFIGNEMKLNKHGRVYSTHKRVVYAGTISTFLYRYQYVGCTEDGEHKYEPTCFIEAWLTDHGASYNGHIHENDVYSTREEAEAALAAEQEEVQCKN